MLIVYGSGLVAANSFHIKMHVDTLCFLYYNKVELNLGGGGEGCQKGEIKWAGEGRKSRENIPSAMEMLPAKNVGCLLMAAILCVTGS